MNIKAFFAILVCKFLRFVSRVLHRGGTAMPGRIALRICPELLGILAKGVSVVTVTGTNGKTTSARMIEEAFEQQGKSLFSNRSGANLISGITTEFVINSSLSGRCRREYAVIECDEGAAAKVFEYMQPKVIVVTNLFRDQPDRFGEVTHTRSLIRDAIKAAPDAVICLNADCFLTATLADEVPNRAVFFGVDKGACAVRAVPAASDAPHCLRCDTPYEYDYISYAHLGGFRCPHCGSARREPDYAVTDIPRQDTQGSTVVLSVRGEKHILDINQPAMYNVYNAAGAAAAICEMGLGIEAAASALARFKCGFGRMERLALGRQGTTMMLIKNPAGADQVLEHLETVSGRFALVICLNDRPGDGTDISWIWDTAFEKLTDMADRTDTVMISGIRAEDMADRIRKAGVPEAKIVVEKDYRRLVDMMAEQTAPIFALPNYTAMLELREAIVRHIGGEEFWV